MLNHTLVNEGNHSRTLPSSPQEKLGHSRSMCFQINCWYYRPMLKYHELALNSCISLQRYYKIYYTVLYKLPRFYNAYGTGGSTMIFFILEPSVFIPRGGHSRTFQLEGIKCIIITIITIIYILDSSCTCCTMFRYSDGI